MYESVSKSLQELESNCSGRGEERVGCVVYDYISLVFCRDRTKIYVRQGRNACSEWYGEGTEQNLEVEIKSAGITWITCWVKKQMWGENIKGSVWTLVIIRNYYTTVQSCPPAALSSLRVITTELGLSKWKEKNLKILWWMLLLLRLSQGHNLMTNPVSFLNKQHNK